MRGLRQLTLWLLGISLALWLILGFLPLSTGSRVVFSLLVIISCGITSYIQWRRERHYPIPDDTNAAGAVLPPEGFQGAVVLVCGDNALLFPLSVAFRETRQGWYLPVKTPEHLLQLAHYLSIERPALIARLSVLLAIMPEQHQERDEFTQSLRTWHRAIVQCKGRLSGIPPVWISSWLSPPAESPAQPERWYTVTPGIKAVQVQEADSGYIPLAEWHREQANLDGQERLSAALWMESMLSWSDQHVYNLLTRPEGNLPVLNPCAWGCCFTSVTSIQGNLWHTHIAGITTLTPAGVAIQDSLPLPDVLLPYLPRRHGVSRSMQTWQRAGLLCGLFLLCALSASFINNQRLIQSIGDHLSLYDRLSGTPSTPKIHAQQQLRADARLLDAWRRSGAPMRLGLGLYQGMRLIAPLEAAINSWAPLQPPPPIVKNIIQGPKIIRLDSLSLFDVGSYQLKPGSTRVLVNALVGIKAKPGWLIVVAGHTDDTGDAASNQLLSLKRAESVRNWMRDTGSVPESCFAVQGYGESRPHDTNDTEAGRAANRRVEISLVPQANACQVTGATTVSPAEGDALTLKMEK
jgi:outer membrane protein OmpA-like peptidoglycan-associated protein